MAEITPIMQTILASLMSNLADRNIAKGLCAKTVLHGQVVPLDYGAESCGGMAWVRLTQAFPSVDFPEPADEPRRSCSGRLAYALEVGVARPAPIPHDSNGEFILPSDQENTATAALQHEDMEAIYEALIDTDIEDLMVEAYNPFGPQGGVVGGAWTLTVSVGT